MALSNSSSAITAGVLLLAAVTIAATAPSNWDVKNVYRARDSDAKAQLSPPRKIRRCACFVKVDPKTNETEWFCTEDSDPRCRRLPLGGLTSVQEKILHQEESEVQEAHQCVCYLKVSEETNFMDFSCNNPHCYQHFVDGQEMANANRWQDFDYECDGTRPHPTDPDCCRCINHKWNCLLFNWYCSRVKCPVHLQVKVSGTCCPVCLEESQSSHSPASIESNQEPASVPLVEEDDTLQSCDCSVCKNIDVDTGELHITISRSHPECQCDLFVHYPYDDLPMCQREQKTFSDKLTKELADMAT